MLVENQLTLKIHMAHLGYFILIKRISVLSRSWAIIYRGLKEPGLGHGLGPGARALGPEPAQSTRPAPRPRTMYVR